MHKSNLLLQYVTNILVHNIRLAILYDNNTPSNDTNLKESLFKIQTSLYRNISYSFCTDFRRWPSVRRKGPNRRKTLKGPLITDYKCAPQSR